MEAQARLAQQDARVAAAGPTGNDATSLAQMTLQGPPATHRAPLIVGVAQPDEYIYVGLDRPVCVGSCRHCCGLRGRRGRGGKQIGRTVTSCASDGTQAQRTTRVDCAG